MRGEAMGLRKAQSRADSKKGFGLLWMSHPRSSGTSPHDPSTLKSCPDRENKKQKQVDGAASVWALGHYSGGLCSTWRWALRPQQGPGLHCQRKDSSV